MPRHAGRGGRKKCRSIDADLSLRAAEARHIHQVLEHFRGNKRRTAKALGLSRSTLDRKLAE